MSNYTTVYVTYKSLYFIQCVALLSKIIYTVLTWTFISKINVYSFFSFYHLPVMPDTTGHYPRRGCVFRYSLSYIWLSFSYSFGTNKRLWIWTMYLMDFTEKLPYLKIVTIMKFLSIWGRENFTGFHISGFLLK